MSDDENPPPLPPLQKALADLKANIPSRQGGSLVPGTSRPWYPLKVGLDKRGRHAIIYSFNCDATSVPREYLEDSKNPRPLTADQQKKLLRVFATLEGIANVRFYEAGKYDPELPVAAKYTPAKAFLSYLRADNIDSGDDSAAGRAYGMQDRGGRRLVVVKGEDAKAMKFFHETSHAVAALSHPQNETFNKSYSNSYTIMGHSHFSDFATDFGFLDALAWQSIYGKSKNPDVRKSRVRAQDLVGNPALYREVPVTLDMGDLPADYFAVIDLARKAGSQLTAPSRKHRESIDTTLVPGTQINDVIAPSNKDRNALRGNEHTNHLQGNSGWDVLMPFGGRDILTGGAESDAFRLDKQSGTNNVITDFTNDDRIEFVLPPPLRVGLRQREDFMFNGTKCKGTVLCAVDEAGKVITSAFVLGRDPQYVRSRVFRVSQLNDLLWYINDEDERISPGVPPPAVEVTPGTPIVPGLPGALRKPHVASGRARTNIRPPAEK